MSRFPLLDQMRAAREEREASAVEPFIATIRAKDKDLHFAWGMCRAKEAEKRELERAFLHPYAERLREVMAEESGRLLHKLIAKAILQRPRPGFDPGFDVEITVPISLLDHTDVRSVTRRVTDYYLNHMEPAVRLRDINTKIRHIEISIPAITSSRELVEVDL